MSNTTEKRTGFWVGLWRKTTMVAGVKNVFAKAGLMALVSLGLYGLFSLVATVFFGLLPVRFLNISANQDANFDVYDLLFRDRGPHVEPGDRKILLVDVFKLDRAGLAELLDTLRHCGPQVVGLDFSLLRKDTEDPVATASLKRVLSLMPNAVVGYTMEQMDDNWVPDLGHYEEAVPDSSRQGFMLLQEGEELATVRYAAMRRRGPQDDDTLWSFSAQLLRAIDTARFNALRSSAQENVRINYRYADRGASYYDWRNADSLLAMNATDRKELLGDRVVLLGYMYTVGRPDMHHSPLNPRPAGRTEPDMSGLEIQARVLGMFLRDDQLKEWPRLRSLVVSFLICFLISLVLLMCYKLNKVLGYFLKVPLYMLASYLVFESSIDLLDRNMVVHIGLLVLPLWLCGEAKYLLKDIAENSTGATTTR